jgi:hypothetical protein
VAVSCLGIYTAGQTDRKAGKREVDRMLGYLS